MACDGGKVARVVVVEQRDTEPPNLAASDHLSMQRLDSHFVRHTGDGSSHRREVRPILPRVQRRLKPTRPAACRWRWGRKVTEAQPRRMCVGIGAAAGVAVVVVVCVGTTVGASSCCLASHTNRMCAVDVCACLPSRIRE